MKPTRKIIAITIAYLLLACGCDSDQQVETALQNSPIAITSTRAPEAFEVFVFMAPSARSTVRKELENLALSDLPGGSVFHLIETPEHRVIASVTVPHGSPTTRVKSRRFQQQYSAAADYFQKQSKPDSTAQLGLPAISDTVLSLRRTSLECRVILCGSPIYDDSSEPTFTMSTGLFPSDGLIGHAHSPWVVEPAFPVGTKISWLVPSNRFGANAKHRKGVARFNRLYLKLLGGHLVRLTPAPDLAFSFANPHLNNDIAKRDEAPAMINPHSAPQLEDSNIDHPPAVIPVKNTPVSFSKPGTLKHEIEMQGGDPSSLEGEAIVLWLVVDGSGSMAGGQTETNSTILRIAESLPALVKSLEIGIAVHRDGAGSRLQVLQILDSELDGGASLRKLKSFLDGVKANGGDAMMQEMLADGMRTLGEAGIGKRQFLMLVADHVGFGPDYGGDFDVAEEATRESLASWCNEPGRDRRVIAMYSGGPGPMESFFREIGATNMNSVFSRQPNDLIRELVSAAIPRAQGVIK